MRKSTKTQTKRKTLKNKNKSLRLKCQSTRRRCKDIIDSKPQLIKHNIKPILITQYSNSNSFLGGTEAKYCKLTTKNIKRQCKLTNDIKQKSNECEFMKEKCYVLSKSKNKKNDTKKKDIQSINDMITLEMISKYRNRNNNKSVSEGLSINDLHKELYKQSQNSMNNYYIGNYWINEIQKNMTTN